MEVGVVFEYLKWRRVTMLFRDDLLVGAKGKKIEVGLQVMLDKSIGRNEGTLKEVGDDYIILGGSSQGDYNIPIDKILFVREIS
jgi:hypothetical protein